MKKIFNLLLLMAIATTISLTSCKTDGCTDPTATNYDDKADNDDGSCTFERDAFIGSYLNCTDTCATGNFNMTISAATENTSTISISNLGGFSSSYSIKATVVGSNITLIPGSLGNGNNLLSGNGKLEGNVLYIDYKYDFPTGTGTNTQIDDCRITAIK